MAVSKQKTSGKSGIKPSAPAKVASAAGKGKAASAPASASDVPAKRVVMTSSEIEAAAQKTEPVSKSEVVASADKAAPVEKSEAVEATKPEGAKPTPGAPAKPAETSVAPAKPVEVAATKSVASAPVVSSPSSEKAEVKTEPAKPAPAKTSAKAKPVAKPGAAKIAAKSKSAAPKSTAPASSPKTEKASTVTTKSKSAATTKTAASAAPKKAAPAKAAPKKVAAAPATETSKTVAKPATSPAPKAVAQPAVTKPAAPKPAAPAAPAEPKVAAKPKAAPAPTIPGDVFGFGSMFMDASAMEPYMDLWKTPEIEAMMTASNDAFEDGVSVASEAFNKMFETMTGQADVFSGAGSRVAAQYEDLIDNQKKSFEEVWQATLTLFEKTGGIGTELATWMQKEFEASQSDLDAMTKVESLADLQELNGKIISRYYESSVAEGEKVQEIMLAAITDSFNAFSKATNAVMK